MQHLDPHSQPFLKSTKCARRRHAIFYPRATDRQSSLRESVAHHPCAVHVNQRTCFHTAVRATWMSSRTSRDKKTWRSALMSAVQQISTGCAACGRFNDIATPCDNSGDEEREKNTRHSHHGSDNCSRIVHGGGNHTTTATSFDLRQRKCLTLHVVAPRKFQHTRHKKRRQPFLPCADSGSQPETQTHAHLVTHFYQHQFEVGCQ